MDVLSGIKLFRGALNIFEVLRYYQVLRCPASAITISPDVSGRKLGPRGGGRSKVWVESSLLGMLS